MCASFLSTGSRIEPAATEALSTGYRPPGARVPHPGAARGGRRRRPHLARRAEAARDPRDPAPRRESCRLGRATRRRPVRGSDSRHRRHAGAAADLRAPQGARRVDDRDPCARIRDPAAPRAARPEAVRAARRRRRPSARTGETRVRPPASLPRRSTSGADRRSPTSPTSRSHRSRSSGSRRSGWPRSSSGSTPSWRSEATQLVGELEELVAEHPLRERFRGQLMLALYRSGRQAEALSVYRRARETLVEEFGIEPTPALRELERAILTQDPSLDLEAPVPHAPRLRGGSRPSLRRGPARRAPGARRAACEPGVREVIVRACWPMPASLRTKRRR